MCNYGRVTMLLDKSPMICLFCTKYLLLYCCIRSVATTESLTEQPQARQAQKNRSTCTRHAKPTNQREEARGQRGSAFWFKDDCDCASSSVFPGLSIGLGSGLLRSRHVLG